MSKKLSVSILITVFTLVFGQTDEKFSTPSPLEVICNQTKSCQQYDEIVIKEDKYKDLRTRKCMCDEKCPMYGDCCEDSIHRNTPTHHNVPFSCKKTFFDGYVYMVDTCAPGYLNTKIIENCKTTNQIDLVRNFLLTIPVTNLSTNITYKNGFCALCNNDLNFEFWQPVLYFKWEKLDLDIKPDPKLILSQMKVDETRSELVSVVKSITYVCNIVDNLPNEIAPAVRYCLSDSNDRLCSTCEKGTSANNCIENLDIYFINIVVLQLNNRYLPKIDICDDIPAEVTNKNVFCGSSKSQVKEQPEPGIDQCFFTNDKKKLCLINEFYDQSQYKFIENGSLYVEKFHYAFPPHEYTNETDKPGSVYVCGTEIPMSDTEKSQSEFRNILTEILMKFSIFLLALYLFTNANKQKLQSLSNKVLSSFGLTLLLLYLVFEIAQWMASCKIASVILHYLFLSCFAWLLIASCHFWQLVRRSSTKSQTLDGKTHLKRYLLYCFFGWISPLSIMTVAIYFELAPNRTVGCSLKPGYGRLNQCFISQSYPKYYFFLYPSTAIFICIIGLFAHASYNIYSNKCKNIKSTAQMNHYVLYLKLALAMGLTWTLGLLVTYTNLNFFKILYVILNASHGTFMFFAYGFKSTMLTRMCKKHENKPAVSQDSPTQEMQRLT